MEGWIRQGQNRCKNGAIGFLAVVLMAVGVSGCRTVDAGSTADKGTDFTRFHSYSYTQPDTSAGHTNLSELNRQRVQAEVDAEMARRLLRPAVEGDLVFLISLATAEATYDRADPTVESGSMGANLSKHYGLRYDENSGSQPIVEYKEGTLLFRAMERSSNRTVWEGSANGVLYKNRSDEQVQKRIHEAVAAVFKNFPIQPASR
jgi:hypothetical protein